MESNIPQSTREQELENDLRIVCGTFKTISDVLNLQGTEGDNSMVFMKVAQLLPQLSAEPEKFGFNNPKLMEIVNKYGKA